VIFDLMAKYAGSPQNFNFIHSTFNLYHFIELNQNPADFALLLFGLRPIFCGRATTCFQYF